MSRKRKTTALRLFVSVLTLLFALVNGSSALMYPKSVEKLVEESDRIVVGAVTDVVYEKERIPLAERDGQIIEGEIVFTYVTVRVTESIYSKTQNPNAYVVFRVWGGQHNGMVSVSNTDPILNRDDQVLLFLSEAQRPGSGGKGVYRLTNAKGGAFKITNLEDNSQVAVRDFSRRSLEIPGFLNDSSKDPIGLDLLLNEVRKRTSK